VIPESLGNTTLVLPPGVVCDGCNNYFSREVERPFLESEPIASVRFQQALPSKRGRVPPAEGILTPDLPVSVERLPSGPFASVITADDPGLLLKLARVERPMICFEPRQAVSTTVVSRFLGKVGLEAMAARLLGHPEGLSYLVDEVQLDRIRQHARQGGRHAWPYSGRRIYPEGQAWRDGERGHRQVKWELDLFVTETGEWYVVLALFGVELVLNLGGPEIDGYVEWLWRHGHQSPLYVGKNKANSLSATVPAPRTRVRTGRPRVGSKALLVAKRR